MHDFDTIMHFLFTLHICITIEIKTIKSIIKNQEKSHLKVIINALVKEANLNPQKSL
jgi:hypothetical protein